jgi:hypothetical protein
MTVRRLKAGVIAMEGDCSIDDAEPLLQLLLAEPRAAVDWTACDRAHAALLQLLMAAAPALVGPPRGAFLRDQIAPALARRGR